MENKLEGHYSFFMRKLLSLLMFVMLVFGAFLPPTAQTHAGGPISISTAHDNMEIADLAASMKCCQKSETGMDHRAGNCGMDCHYLPVFLASQPSPVMANVRSTAHSGLQRQPVYFPMRPPISI